MTVKATAACERLCKSSSSCSSSLLRQRYKRFYGIPENLCEDFLLSLLLRVVQHRPDAAALQLSTRGPGYTLFEDVPVLQGLFFPSS